MAPPRERTTEDKTSLPPLFSLAAIFRFRSASTREPAFSQIPRGGIPSRKPSPRIENSCSSPVEMTHIAPIDEQRSPSFHSNPARSAFIFYIFDSNVRLDGPLNLADTSSAECSRLCTLDEPFSRDSKIERKGGGGGERKGGGREIRGNVFPRRMRVDLGADSHRGIGHDLRSPSDDWIMRVFAILFGRNHPLPSILHAVDESNLGFSKFNSQLTASGLFKRFVMEFEVR